MATELQCNILIWTSPTNKITCWKWQEQAFYRKTLKYPQLEADVLSFVHNKRNAINMHMIRFKDCEEASKMGINRQDFQASADWYVYEWFITTPLENSWYIMKYILLKYHIHIKCYKNKLSKLPNFSVNSIYTYFSEVFGRKTNSVTGEFSYRF